MYSRASNDAPPTVQTFEINKATQNINLKQDKAAQRRRQVRKIRSNTQAPDPASAQNEDTENTFVRNDEHLKEDMLLSNDVLQGDTAILEQIESLRSELSSLQDKVLKTNQGAE